MRTKEQTENLSFIECYSLLQEAVAAGMIHRDPNERERPNNIMIFREAGFPACENPEGWFSENIQDVAAELMSDVAGYQFIKGKLQELKEEANNLKKFSYSELTTLFRDHERNATDGTHLSACIVFTEDSFTEPYSLESRTYAVSSNNKAFQPNMGGYSIYGSAIDGSDPMIRLERYMAAEKGGNDGWKVDYCYLTD